MAEVKLNLDNNGNGVFFILDDEEQVAEMVIRIAEQTLIVFHTEVAPEAEVKGLAKELLATMVAYAREKSLKVMPLCPYVHAQFRRNPEAYADLWTSGD